MEVGATEGHEFDFSAMFDRVHHPARGRQGGRNGAPTTISQDDGTPMKGKGKQFVPHGRRVMLAFPGGAGYGKAGERAPDLVRRDLARGYISEETAKRDYGLSDTEVADVLDAVKRGEARLMSLAAISNVPKSSAYDVVIVGGAMYGSSVAWFLSDNPDFDGSILVVEKDPTYEFTSTAHTNSCMRQQFSNEINVRISQFAAEFVKNFRAFMGGDPRVPELSIQSYGYMYLADNEAFAEVLTRKPETSGGMRRGHQDHVGRRDQARLPVLQHGRHRRRQPQPGRRGLFRRQHAVRLVETLGA